MNRLETRERNQLCPARDEWAASAKIDLLLMSRIRELAATLTPHAVSLRGLASRGPASIVWR